MTIVLIGPPAAGKTRLGKRLAARLKVPFVDTDSRIVAAHGPIPAIFAEHGEPHFRAIEREIVAAALGEPGVVSLGGGAVIDRDTQADLADALVVLLTVSPEAIASRIGSGKRPLVTDVESWERLVAARSDIYTALADYTADTSNRPIDAIVEEIAAWVEEGQR
ncbi:shikimate kinase [Leifsonia sp. NPDC102414]|uniref:shikimate kinase n=1 Tax=Leifsonia sp. NPDC102414 TaxID=3364124 RepID=UPI0038213BC0